MPKVSICMPVYNGSKYLRESIESVLNQSLEDFELLINDDCSTDTSEEIILGYMKNDHRIKYNKNSKNLGLVGNWNKSIEVANGEFIKLMCQDDILEKECILKQAKILENNEDVSLVTCSTYVIDEIGKKILKRKNFEKTGKYDGKISLKNSFLFAKNIFGEPSIVMYRRSVIEKIGRYNEVYKYVPDWDYSNRILMYGNLYYIDEYLASFRVSAKSETFRLMKGRSRITYEEHKKFVKAYIENGFIEMSNIQIKWFEIKIWFTIKLKILFLKYFVRSR